MSTPENGGLVDRVMTVIIQHSAYGAHYYIFGAIITLARYVVVSVPGNTLQAEVIRWAAAVACAIAFTALIGLAIWDLLRKKKPRRRQPQKS